MDGDSAVSGDPIDSGSPRAVATPSDTATNEAIESTSAPSEPPESAATQLDPSDSVPAVSFERTGAWRGFLKCLPVAIGVGGYGVAFGMLADRVGLNVFEAALMSGTVLAGASQIVAVELWAEPIPVATILLATIAINLRYSIMGAALTPWFEKLSPLQAYGSLFFMADENWALTMSELKSGGGRGAFLLGSGIAIWLFWVASTIVGVLAGGAIGEPARFGLDFVLATVFVALAVDLWDGRASVVPWTVALVTAIGTEALLPGQWYIIAGGAAAALVEVSRNDA